MELAKIGLQNRHNKDVSRKIFWALELGLPDARSADADQIFKERCGSWAAGGIYPSHIDFLLNQEFRVWDIP